VLPYFIRAEHQERGASEFHGIRGPLSVSDLRTINPMSEAFLGACAELGLPLNDDFNGAEQDGFGRFQVTQKDAQRCSASTGYLRPALTRPNLTVETRAHVTRVLFEGQRAVGVCYIRDGNVRVARANAEVILSGGTINSPQLLMLSGIGPAAQLEAVGLPVVHDLPGVGQNLQDHPILSVAYQATQPISLANAESVEAIEEYALFATGPLTSNGGEVGGFVRTSPDLVAPDLQFHFNAVWFLDHGFTLPEGHGFSFGPTMLQPKSRGSITLRSSDPFAPPRIQPRYFDEPTDLDPLVEGVKIARELVHTRAFAAFAGPEHTPGSTVRTDAQIRAFVRERVETVYHPCGTCQMGVDRLAVVDPDLRVRGIEGLRIVDASVMPNIINGALNAPTIMIAEKAADLIRGREPLAPVNV
jgi:choline dehydrogenase